MMQILQDAVVDLHSFLHIGRRRGNCPKKFNDLLLHQPGPKPSAATSQILQSISVDLHILLHIPYWHREFFTEINYLRSCLRDLKPHHAKNHSD
jgi:hypothetical protein